MICSLIFLLPTLRFNILTVRSDPYLIVFNKCTYVLSTRLTHFNYLRVERFFFQPPLQFPKISLKLSINLCCYKTTKVDILGVTEKLTVKYLFAI